MCNFLFFNINQRIHLENELLSWNEYNFSPPPLLYRLHWKTSCFGKLVWPIYRQQSTFLKTEKDLRFECIFQSSNNECLHFHENSKSFKINFWYIQKQNNKLDEVQTMCSWLFCDESSWNIKTQSFIPNNFFWINGDWMQISAKNLDLLIYLIRLYMKFSIMTIFFAGFVMTRNTSIGWQLTYWFNIGFLIAPLAIGKFLAHSKTLLIKTTNLLRISPFRGRNPNLTLLQYKFYTMKFEVNTWCFRSKNSYWTWAILAVLVKKIYIHYTDYL